MIDVNKQIEFVNKLSHRLDKFSIKSLNPYEAIFRCPLCGDSKINKNKKRGFIYEKNRELYFTCHNECGTKRFSTLIKLVDPSLYSQYNFAMFSSSHEQENTSTTIERKQYNIPAWCFSLKDLPTDHEANKYMDSRHILPLYSFQQRKHDVYYFEDYINIINNHFIPNKFKTHYPDPRIVFPVRNTKKELIGLVGRSLIYNDSRRYSIISLYDNEQMIYNIENVDLTKKIFILEGTFDTFFIENSVAMCGLNKLPSIRNATFVIDNEPRNPSVIKQYEKIISAGHDIVIWPNSIEQKDPNEMYNNGINPNSIVLQNCYSGMTAKLKLQKWKKM